MAKEQTCQQFMAEKIKGLTTYAMPQLSKFMFGNSEKTTEDRDIRRVRY
jgi:hypothetical protein